MKGSIFSVHYASTGNSEATFKIEGNLVSGHHSSFLSPVEMENLAKITRDLQCLHKLDAYENAEPIEKMIGMMLVKGIRAKRVGRVIVVMQEDWLSRLGGLA